jgi:magnesium-transporting ATPase (P-type)
MRMPDNLGEKRECLVILEKVGFTKGLLDSIATDGKVSDLRLTFHRLELLETSRTSRADKNCNYNSTKFNCSNTLISFGENIRKLPKSHTAFEIFYSALFEDDLVRLLLIVATFSFIVSFFANQANGWVAGVSIYIAVLFMSTVTTICNYSKESQFKSLKMQIQAEEATVIRGQYGVST